MTDETPPVGYGNPPAAHRFRKGRSGNPSGRRKVPPTTFEEAAQVFDLPVITTIKGRRKTLTMTKAMFRQVAKRAIAGEARTMKELVDLMFLLGMKADMAEQHDLAQQEEILQRTAKLLKLDPDKLRAGRGPSKVEVDERLHRDPRMVKREQELRAEHRKRGSLTEG